MRGRCLECPGLPRLPRRWLEWCCQEWRWRSWLRPLLRRLIKLLRAWLLTGRLEKLLWRTLLPRSRLLRRTLLP